MRERIYTIISKAEDGDKASNAYDWFIMCVAVCSIIPMTFREGSHPAILKSVETITVYLLFFDYMLRWITYDFHYKNHTKKAFFIYPVTPFAIMDILGILPSIGLLPKSFMILRLLRLSKILHYSKSGRRIVNVFKNQGKTLFSVLIIAVAYIFVSALIMFSYEPADNFPTFFDALYWSTTALTTVGYGDIYPCTQIGQFISMLSSLFGVAVIAMPAGIVTAGFMDELNKDLEEEKEKHLRASGEKIEYIGLTPEAQKKRNAKITRYAIIMGISVALNIGFYFIAHTFHLPMWMDSIGTAYAAVVLQPAAGLIVAFATNFFQSAVFYGSSSIVYYFVGAVVAISFGVIVRKAGKIDFKRIPLSALCYIICGTLVAGLLTIWRTSGIPDSGWERHFYEILLQSGVPSAIACFGGTAVLKIMDGIIIMVLVPVLYALTPKSKRGC